MVLEREFQRVGIPHVSVREPDVPYNGALTAIGLMPVADRSAIKRIVSKLPLFGREDKKREAV